MKFESYLRAACLLLRGTIYAGILLLLSANAQAQNLFETDDSDNGYILDFAPSTPSGTYPIFANGFDGPIGLAFNSAGNLFEADYDGGNVYEFTPGGTRTTFVSGLNNPVGLAFNSAGNLFEADYGSGNINEFTTNEMQSMFATGLNGPTGLAFDNAGDLFEADYNSGSIYEFTNNNGTLSQSPALFASGLNSPFGLAFDSAGDLFESDNGSGSIYEFVNNNGTLSSSPTLFVSGLNDPLGLAFDSAGDLFEADNGNGNIDSGNIYEFTNYNGTLSSNPTPFVSGLNPYFLAFRGAVQIAGLVQTAGIYGGQVDDMIFGNPNAGDFAVFIGTNGQGTIEGFDTNTENTESGSQAGGVAAQFYVSTNGSWQFSSNNTIYGVSGFGTVGGDGSFSGELDFTNGDSVLLNGSQQSPLGTFPNAAGYYTGTFSGTSGGQPISGLIDGVLSANGQITFTVFVNGAENDGGQGQIGANNQFTTTNTGSGATVSGTLTNSTLKIGGTFNSQGGGSGTFTISRSAYILQVVTTNLPDGTTTVPYSQTLAASGGPTNYSWGIISGGLPAGLSLSISGVISGTPTMAETTNFIVQVTNAVGVTASQALTLGIYPFDTSVIFTVTPAAVSNTYTGQITLQVAGLNSGETVTIQKFLNVNTNEANDAGELLVQQYNLTDGQAFVIDGVTNFNVPGDENATTGAITTTLNFNNGDFIGNTIGQYQYKLSSTYGHFAPITNQFNVTNFPFGQKITGNVVISGTSTAVSNAVILLFPPPRAGEDGPGNPLASVVANSSGAYSVQAPPGIYVPVAVGNNYVANYSSSPVITLGSGATITTNLALTSATASITGSIVDSSSGIGLPGIFMPGSDNNLIAISFTGTNGNFNMAVTAGQWGLGSDDSGLIVHGYVGLQNKTKANSGATNVTLALPEANALFYGTVMDSLGNPIPGLDVNAYDNNNIYNADGYTDENGNFVVGVLGLGSNDPWQIQANGNNTLNNYVFSQPIFDNNGGTNLNAGQSVLVNFTAIPTTNQITGHVQDNFGKPIVGVQIYTYENTNGVTFSANSGDTDTNGNYLINVVNGIWTVGVNYCNEGGGNNDCLSTSYVQPPDENIYIFNTNGVLNFTIQTNVNIGGTLTVTTTSLPNGIIGAAYSQELEADGGQPSYNWSQLSGSLPSGLSLDSNGFINGTPTASGTNNFTVQVTDQNSSTATKNLTLIVKANLTPPVLAITDITTGMLVSNASFTVMGTATDNVAVAAVYVLVSNSVVNTGFNLASTANDWANWSTNVTLSPGTNIVSAYAVDISGNISTTNTVKLVYVASAVLTVQTNGVGSITPNDNGAALQIGVTYMLTASSNTGSGFAFTNWTGGTGGPLSVLTNGTTLQFAMQNNLVLQANFMDVEAPVLAITNITTGMLVSNASFTVMGTATDNVAIADVYVLVSNSVVNTGFGLASTANNWRNWSTNVTLSPGTNTVSAYAVDTSGNVSTTNTVKLVYVASAVLTVQTNGVGSISPNDNGAALQIGVTYMLTASSNSGSGFAFTNWTGGTGGPLSVLTNGTTLQFAMQSNLTLQANFMDVEAPVLAITNITTGMLVSNASFTVMGTATDNVAVAEVYYSLSNAVMNTGYLPALTANNWRNWNTNVTLSPGTNTVSAYAVDTSGNVSATNTVKIVYVLSAVLTVQTNGVGSITPNDNGAALQIGVTYMLTASSNSGSGFAFTNWTGGTGGPLSVLTNKSALQFAMQSNLTLQANFMDVEAPVLAITNITTGMLVSNASFTVMGTATDNVAVAEVYYSLSNAVMNTGYLPALTANNWRNWNTNVTLSPGTNTVSAYAVDTSGNVSATNTVKIVYVLSAVLTVQTNGVGSITPNDNGAALQIGVTYMLTASSNTGSGFAFTNWTGGTSQPLSVLTNKSALQFTMQSNLVLQANFMDVEAPVLAITNITTGMLVSNASFTVMGTATDNVAVAEVYYSLSNAVMNTGYLPALTANNWRNWNTNVTLSPGTNIVSAYAVDTSGNISTTNTVKLVYVLSAVLTVQTNGVGSITPNDNGAALQIGVTYMLTASSNTGSGFAFTNWTGGTSQPFSVLTNKSVLQFAMQSNLTLQANFMDVEAPVLAITNITTGMLVSNASFTVMGTATDNVAVAEVYYSLSNAVMNTGYLPALTANNWRNWNTNVTLSPGTNIVSAYAVDTSGNISTTNTVKIVYVLSAVLTVQTNGVGSITPNDNGAALQIGVTYTLTATAGTGFMLTNWTGGTSQPLSVLTNKSVLQFMMQSNLMLQANFVETNKPILTITAPTSGQHMTNALATVVGTASDDWKVTGVWYQLNGGEWNQPTSTNSWTNWMTTVELQASTNTIKAYALDMGGNLSTTSSVSFLSSNAFMLQLAVVPGQPLTTNGLNFALDISPNLDGHIQVSTNLTAWIMLTNFIGTNTTLNFHDQAATNFNHRYYRAVIP